MNFHVPTMAELSAQGIKPDVLFWIGCAGSFDERARRVTKAMAKILHKAGVSFAVLGAEEGCTGDPAKRAAAIVKAVTNYNDPKELAKLSEDLGEAMVGINEHEIEVLMAERGQ